jgi:hypothetical protein
MERCLYGREILTSLLLTFTTSVWPLVATMGGPGKLMKVKARSETHKNFICVFLTFH